jgi:hypothetical protein
VQLKDVAMLEERLFAITFKADFEELIDEAQKVPHLCVFPRPESSLRRH